MLVRTIVRVTVSVGTLVAVAVALPAAAKDTPPAAAPAAATDDTPPPKSDAALDGDIVITATGTRSSTTLPGSEMQKILPGVSPLKAIATLPGVLYITADPWGYNEQNAQIFIHGFAGNQLG